MDLDVLEQQLEEADQKRKKVENARVVFGELRDNHGMNGPAKIRPVRIRAGDVCAVCREDVQEGEYVRYCTRTKQLYHLECSEGGGCPVTSGVRRRTKKRDSPSHTDKAGKVVEMGSSATEDGDRSEF